MRKALACLAASLIYTLLKVVLLAIFIGEIFDGLTLDSQRFVVSAYLDGFCLLVFVAVYSFLTRSREKYHG